MSSRDIPEDDPTSVQGDIAMKFISGSPCLVQATPFLTGPHHL